MDAVENMDSLLPEVLKNYNELKSELILLREENRKLREKSQGLKRENRALHLVRKRLIEERQADKEVIRQWQAKLDERNLVGDGDVVINTQTSQTEASTQDGAPDMDTNVPSSPPAQPLKLEFVESLSQRALPMSIGVSEAEEKDEVLTEAPEDIDLDMRPADKADRLQPPQTKKRPLSFSEEALTSFIHSKEWHPADFKINPNYSENRNFGVERNKLRRKCLHGADCPDCAKFYSISGTTAAIQAGSRHRFALDKQQTPPGYWNMDFPESSMIAAEKEETSMQIRQEARNRLEEAMVGGRYVFKDDQLNRAVANYNS